MHYTQKRRKINLAQFKKAIWASSKRRTLKIGRPQILTTKGLATRALAGAAGVLPPTIPATSANPDKTCANGDNVLILCLILNISPAAHLQTHGELTAMIPKFKEGDEWLSSHYGLAIQSQTWGGMEHLTGPS
jgi:hypothetical protein